MAINQKQVLSLQQKLSPQQIQMIKLLELPTVQLEQRIKQEIEDNIVLGKRNMRPKRRSSRSRSPWTSICAKTIRLPIKAA